MVNRWRHRTLVQGDRRPEPTAAALACGLAWCYFGHVNDQAEPFRLNALGALLQALYLVTYLCLRTPEERKHALLPILAAVCYLYTTLLIPYADADGLKSMCTLAGLVSAAASLLTFAFLVDEWSVAMLPPWGMSCFSMLHGFAWFVRGFNKQDGHPAYAMAIQNGAGAVCSFVLLLLAWYCPPAPTAQDRDARGNLIDPAPTQTHGVIPNRESAATDDEARAVLINQDLVDVAKAAGTASAPPATHSHCIDIHELERITAEAQARRDLVMDLNQDFFAVVAGKQQDE